MVANFTALRHVAEQLKLRMEPAEQALFKTTALLSGTVDGTYIEIEQWQADYLHVYVRACLTPPADLGFSLEPAGVGAKLGELLGKHDVQIGDPSFDDAYLLHASEPERARALFTPALLDALQRWKQANADFVVTDESVYLRLPLVPLFFTGALTSRDVHTPELLLTNLRAAVALAKTFDGALAALAPSKALEKHAEAFRSYAAAHGLAFSPSPLEIHGHLGGARFFAHPRVRPEHTAVAISLRFDAELPSTIRVRPRQSLNILQRLKATRGSTATGDDVFDEAFSTLVADASAAGAWLSEPVRKGLLALQAEAGDVELDSRGITVTTRSPAEPSSFAAIFDRACEVERSLRAAVRAG